MTHENIIPSLPASDWSVVRSDDDAVADTDATNATMISHPEPLLVTINGSLLASALSNTRSGANDAAVHHHARDNRFGGAFRH
eukprot:5659717-Pyramimonas_sp.AAC.1